MTKQELVDEILKWGLVKSNDQTLKNTYADTLDLDSLAKAVTGNRLQSGWKKAEIIVF